MVLAWIVAALVGILVGSGATIFYRNVVVARRLKNAKDQASDSLIQANKQVQEILAKAQKDAQEILTKGRQSLESEVRTRQQGVEQIENRLMQKEKHMDEREGRLTEKDAQLSDELERVKQLKKQHEEQESILNAKLENIAALSQEEAKEILLKNVEKQVRQRAGRMIKDIEEQAQKIANRKAKEIVTKSIQRTAMDHVVSATTSVVQLPDDDLKGRIIGKEGRNIRSFEAATGVDVIIDDTPGAVILSAFDPIRREIAKLSLEKLVVDGRIHPARVEEAVEKSKSELAETIRQRGERAAEELNLRFHPKIVELIGKLHYRTSYGQNMLGHAIESARIAGYMAQELGVNVDLSKRGAMLHDIGKALDFEQEGTHTHIGEEICRKYGESEEVINCINAHHEDEDPDTIEAVIVMVADAISSSRPGARRESVDTYVKRLEKLEALANSFDGVATAYAIQAGREIRVMVNPDKIDDLSAKKLAFDIAQKIESELEYPGEVKVTIVRETRAVGVAR